MARDIAEHLSRVVCAGPEVDAHFGADLLALGVAPATRDGHAPVILGVARQGSLLTWDVPKTLLGPILQGRAQAVGRHPAAVSPKTPTRPLTPHTLSGVLLSAQFGPEGQTLLLVCGSGWLLLESDETGFEGGPRHLVPCAWGSRPEAAVGPTLPLDFHRGRSAGNMAESIFTKGGEMAGGSQEEAAGRRVGAAETAMGSWEDGAGAATAIGLQEGHEGCTPGQGAPDQNLEQLKGGALMVMGLLQSGQVRLCAMR
jgi:hypothetical protein